MLSDISILTLQPADPGRAVQTPDRAHSARVGHDRQVLARDLHPGDIVRQCDWSLHVRGIEVGPAAVAIAVTEFGFALRYAADAQVQLAA
jgi:hypothetical protein